MAHFCSKEAHQGPLKSTDPAYKGSWWNLRVTWENGKVTYEPLSIAKLNLYSCTIYAKENGLLQLPGGQHFARLAQKKILRLD